jgi:hypothetical protein
VTTFDIPPDLTVPTHDLRLSYSKYLKLQEVSRKLISMKTAGTWTRKTVENDIVTVFFARSTYFKYPYKIFPKVHNNPNMEAWLRNGDNAPAQEDVWGSKKATFTNLAQILKVDLKSGNELENINENSQEESESGSEVEKTRKKTKGKGRQRESDTELDSPVKTKGKAKKSHKRAKKS